MCCHARHTLTKTGFGVVGARKDCPYRLREHIRSRQNVRIIVTYDRHQCSQRWQPQEVSWFPVEQASSAISPI